ncbi:TetR/AcrR family transcriptional regulator [Undibacterium sp. TJN19]|uniref:TetR/AcrR family transcriptional regulator n=1 Tax=Undibacterium sp. TJN19 TaxID=3413055 RepID=UPI003BF2D199
MGSSKAEKAENHERIVRIAAARFREIGIEGIGVADLMKDAGMTHGGFYRHFASREELVAEAVARALQDGGQAVAAIANSTQSRQILFTALVDGYLSIAHRDGLASSCAVTALAADVARSNDKARSAYTSQVSLYLKVLGELIASEKSASKRTAAIAALATMVGAVSLARAVNDAALSDEILQSAARELKARMA